jgi:N-acetylglucosaminyldiphosphoundecaprenol N-acetyl-beta-D-mannosaminyltransferase
MSFSTVSYAVVTSWPAKEDVLGTGISITSFDEVMHLFDHVRRQDRAITVNVCNVHSIMSARRDAELAEALAAGEVNTPDGVPVVWFMRSRGRKDQVRMYGPDLAMHAFAYGIERGWRHYFYGATPQTLERLRDSLARLFPGIQIVGCHAPPFRELTESEREQVLANIQSAKPDIVWVGLGMPKQEKWIYDVRGALPGMVLVGIGAAFDFLAGTKAQAPKWMQRSGLEWVFRLGTEPRRLWRRYIWNNPAFLALWLADFRRARSH